MANRQVGFPRAAELGALARAAGWGAGRVANLFQEVVDDNIRGGYRDDTGLRRAIMRNNKRPRYSSSEGSSSSYSSSGRSSGRRTGGNFRGSQLSKVSVCAPRCVKKELKFIDFNLTAGTVDQTGEVLLQLMTIPQDVTESTRVGRMAYIHSIAIKAFLFQSLGANASAGARFIKLALIQDRQTNGAAASWDDIYDDLYEGGNTLVFPNLSNAKRFRIVKEWHRVIQNTSASTTGTNYGGVVIEEVLQLASKGNGIPIQYNADFATGQLSTIESNNFFIVGVAGNGDDLVQLRMNVRVRFTD